MECPPEFTSLDVIRARFSFLFTNVICIFVDDFPTLDAVVERLKTWAAAGVAATSPTERRCNYGTKMKSDKCGEFLTAFIPPAPQSIVYEAVMG